ncbi:MAG: hypothetical protein QM756_41140 [Polyangiaceae bacterium]
MPVDDRVPSSNGDGMDTHLFRPAVDSKGFFSVNGSDILGKRDISFGLVLDYGLNLMRTRAERQAPRCKRHGRRVQNRRRAWSAAREVAFPALVQNSFQGTFGFNYGIANLGVVGVSNPRRAHDGRFSVSDWPERRALQLCQFLAAEH